MLFHTYLPILGPKSNRHIRNSIPTPKLLEYLQHQFLLVGTKVHYRLTNVFFGSVAEDIQLRLVGPEDDAIAVEPVHGDGGVLEEVDELGVSGAEGRCVMEIWIMFVPRKLLQKEKHMTILDIYLCHGININNMNDIQKG